MLSTLPSSPEKCGEGGKMALKKLNRTNKMSVARWSKITIQWIRVCLTLALSFRLNGPVLKSSYSVFLDALETRPTMTLSEWLYSWARFLEHSFHGHIVKNRSSFLSSTCSPPGLCWISPGRYDIQLSCDTLHFRIVLKYLCVAIAMSISTRWLWLTTIV